PNDEGEEHRPSEEAQDGRVLGGTTCTVRRAWSGGPTALRTGEGRDASGRRRHCSDESRAEDRDAFHRRRCIGTGVGCEEPRELDDIGTPFSIALHRPPYHLLESVRNVGANFAQVGHRTVDDVLDEVTQRIAGERSLSTDE